MKKVLSLVLALAMVIGMSSVAFAAVANVTYGSVLDLGSFTYGDITTKVDTSTSTTGFLPDTSPTNAMAFAAITAASGATLGEMKNFMENFQVVPNGGGGFNIYFEPSVINTVTGAYLPVGNYQVTIVLYDNVTVSLATESVTYRVKFKVVSAGTTATDTIPSTYKITGVADNWTRFVEWKSGINASDNFPKVTEDTTMSFDLVAGMFYWEDQDGKEITYATGTPGAMTKVRTTHLKNVTIRKTNLVNNSGTVKSVEIDGTTLKIKTVTYFLKCGNTDVSLDLDLAYKSSASNDKLYVSFNIYNEKIEVDNGQYSVDTTGHVYIQATESVRDLEMEIGEGLSLFKGFGTDQKAYARVSLELSAGDEKLFQQYSELSDVYTLHTVGVQSANVYAQFNDLDDTYFVYDENFKLLGTTTDKKLAFSNKYYLTTKKVDLAGTSVSDEDSEPASESTPTDIGNAGTGGGSTAVVNNYNPNTGA